MGGESLTRRLLPLSFVNMVAIFLFASVVVAYPKDIRFAALAKPQTGATHEQTNFGVEDDFQHPVPLPAAALEALRASKDKSDMVQECAEDAGIKPSEVPASWFTASSLRLTNRPGSGLVVRGETQCLAGA